MSAWEIAGGIAVLFFSVLISVVCLMQEQKPQSMSSALMGGADMDSYFGKNKGRTKEARLAKLTTILSIILGVVVILLNIVYPIIKKAIG